MRLAIIIRFISCDYRLCVNASGSVITEIFKFFTLIRFSCLHFGQYRGKFFISVSSRISCDYRLCVNASGSVITEIFKFFTLIRFSCLHFGQYRGKFFISVSSRILNRVLLLHTGHKIHFSCCNAPPHF